MALDDDKALVAAVGYVYTAAPGTAAPSADDLDNVADFELWSGTNSEWKLTGHTSRDDLPEFGFEGGEKEVRGTWQRKRVREVESGDPVVDSVTVILQQFDADALELYYGENASSTPGEFGVSGKFEPVERAILIVLVDGDARLGFYAPNASISRDESIELPIDNFAGLPVRAKFLDYPGQSLFKWISSAFLGTVSNVFNVSVGAASAGNFTLTFAGNTTATIAYDANAAAVKAALVALDDGFPASKWTVTGSGPWEVTTPGGKLTGSGTGLTGGTFSITSA